MTHSLTLRRPDDWHLHLRDGAMLRAVLPETARHFGRAIIMPNLVPPVVTGDDARAYRDRILAALPEGIFTIALAGHVVFLAQIECGQVATGHDPHRVVIHLRISANGLHVVLLVELGIELPSQVEAVIEGLLRHATALRVLEAGIGIVDRQRLVFGLEEAAAPVDSTVAADEDGAGQVRVESAIEL